MDRTRIAALLVPFLGGDELQNNQALLESISMYVDILQRWNARINLTAIRDPEQIVTRHFGESLFAAAHLLPKSFRDAPEDTRASVPVHIADVGSGAGFPGIPMKLWNPEVSLTLIESNQKKATFLREVTRALILTDINILGARAEALPQGTFGLVTLRAVERFDKVLPVAARLVQPQGRLALLIGDAQLNQARSLLPEHDFSPPIPIPLSQSRVLAVARSR